MINKIIIINLKERPDRLDACLNALDKHGTSRDIIEVFHPMRVSDFISQDAFLKYAGLHGFPTFLELQGMRHELRYLSVHYAHLHALSKLEQMPEGEIGLILEDDQLLNVNFQDLSNQLLRLQQDSQMKGNPLICVQLARWGHAEKYISEGIDKVVQSNNDFFYGHPACGSWANVYDSRAARVLKESFLRDLVPGYKNPSDFGITWCIDQYLYVFGTQYGIYTAHRRSDFFIQNRNIKSDNVHKRGIYAGVWDLLHPGHLFALQWAKEKCDKLTAAINIDPTLDNPLKEKPLESEEGRMERLKACRYVDEIITYTGEAELEQLYQSCDYNIAFISVEHKDNYTPTHDVKPIFVPRPSEHSSTELRKRIRDTS